MIIGRGFLANAFKNSEFGYKYIDYDDATDKGSVLWHDPDFYILWSIVTLILSDI